MAKLTDIKNILDDLLAGFENQNLLNKLGLGAISKVRRRTLKGIDVEGKPFEDYTDDYADFRESIGLPVDVVSLQASNASDDSSMLNRIAHKVAGNLKSVDIDIDDPEKREIASYHDSLGVGKTGNKIRHFWDVNEKERGELLDIVETDINDLLLDLTREANQ